MRHIATVAAVTVGIVLGSACGGGGGGTNPPPPPPPPPPGSPIMAKANPSGDAQSGPVGTVLPFLLRVSITQNGTAVAGRPVTWQIQPSSGSVNPSSPATLADGIASATVSLPPFGATSTITASSSGVTNSPLSFSAISTGAGMAVTVNVVNTSFQPAQFQLKQGGTVTFIWGNGSLNHNVTPVPPNTIPTSSNPAPPATHNAPYSFEVTFPTTGGFKFFCSAHGAPDSGMSGTITVVP